MLSVKSEATCCAGNVSICCVAVGSCPTVGAIVLAFAGDELLNSWASASGLLLIISVRFCVSKGVVPTELREKF